MAFDEDIPADDAPPDGSDPSDEWPDIYLPSPLDAVLEVAGVMSGLAAQRFVRVDEMRRDALAEAARHGRFNTEIQMRSLRLELAAALRVTENTAGEMIARAEALVERYPTVLDSLWDARMTERHAEILVDALDDVEAALRDQLVERALELAESQPVGSFRRALRRLIDTVRAATLAERHREALQTRRVLVEPVGDGMAWFMTLMPVVEAHAGFERLTAIAKVIGAQDDETRTLDQLRADAFGDLLIDGRTDAQPVEARGIRATVVVTVPALALLGADDSPAGDPPVVEGIGPIPMAQARELCGGADGWMRVLTHPETGMVLSVGRDLYRPPPSLRKLVKWRAERCMAPGCGVPASRCQVDHNLAWEHGGCTSLDNHAPFCQGHHTVKHHGGWQVRQIAGSGGAIEWISPAGRRYVVQPERRVPVFTPPTHADAPF